MQLSVLRPAQSGLPEVNPPSFSWSVGQLVHGTVLRRLSATQVVLSIAGDKLMAFASSRLVAGQQLLLRVSSLEPQPLLHLISSPLTTLPGQRQVAGMALGYQGSALRQLLNTLVWVSNERKPFVSGLPETLRGLMGGVLSGVRTANTLTVPATLQRILWDAGLLLEARLASISPGMAATSEIDLDCKARLLQLRHTLDQHLQRLAGGIVATGASRSVGRVVRRSPSLTELLGVAGAFLERLLATVELVVQRLEARQLSSLASAAKQGFAWHVEIPFWCAGSVRTVELVIERHATNAVPDLAVWTASVTLDAPELGVVHSRVTLTAESIAVQFWAARSATLAQLSARTERLANDLSRLGLAVTSIRCEQDMPAGRPRANNCLIQVHA